MESCFRGDFLFIISELGNYSREFQVWDFTEPFEAKIIFEYSFESGEIYQILNPNTLIFREIIRSGNERQDYIVVKHLIGDKFEDVCLTYDTNFQTASYPYFIIDQELWKIPDLPGHEIK